MEHKKGSILEEYINQLNIDKENENNDFPQGSTLTDDDKEEYEKFLTELRDSNLKIEKEYEKKKKEMEKITEQKLISINRIIDEEVSVNVRHAYCDDCGEELICDGPPMFNPYTMEKICKHVCKKCGKVFNLEYAYPRTIFVNKYGNEINAFGI